MSFFQTMKSCIVPYIRRNKQICFGKTMAAYPQPHFQIRMDSPLNEEISEPMMRS